VLFESTGNPCFDVCFYFTLDRVQDKPKEELKMETAVFVRAQCAKSDTMRHIVVQMGFALWVFSVSF
jgi:hypothetical protein